MTMLAAAPSPDTRLLLIGAGFIAQEYIKALHTLGLRRITILSRGEARVRALVERYGVEAYGGGEAELSRMLPDADAVIVGASIEVLPTYAEALAAANHPRVLMEKPLFLSTDALDAFMARHPAWDCAIALNRLFYPSVHMLRAKLEEERLRSAQFTFTEWVHRINPQDYTPHALARWGMSNCIHVISTVFALIGLPASLHAEQRGAGDIAWHPSGSIYAGSGMSANGIPFSYHADWNSAGRWSISLYTDKGAYSLYPMEGLAFTPRGSVQPAPVMPVWEGEVKCGFEPMLRAFLTGGDMLRLTELRPHLAAVEQMFGYRD